jgi:hypothetical protein
MKKLNYIIILLAVSIFFACKQEDHLFTEDMANVGFYGETATMLELDKSMNGNDALVVQILVTALKNSPSCNVTFEVDNSWYQKIGDAYFHIEDGDTTQVNPAFEGVDFKILSSKTVTVDDGFGYAPVMISSIDNNEYDPLGNKSFHLKITGNSLGYDLSSESVIKVTITDDDHPLGWMLGNFTANVTETSNGNTNYSLTVASVSGEIDKVIIYGMCGPSFGPGPALNDTHYIIGTVSQDSTMLTIISGQEWADWGYGPTTFSVWEDDYGDGEEVDDLVGIINRNGSNVTITFNQAFTFLITSGDFEGYGLGWAYNSDENPNSVTAVWVRQ